MTDLTDMINNLAHQSAVTREPGDFTRNGLVHCGVCGMPKECRVDFGGGPVVVGCICRCERDADERKKQRLAREERMLNVRSLRVQGIQDMAVRGYTFATAERNRNIVRCQTYVERWPEMLENNTGLLFWGNVGTGKTFAAACIANAVIDRSVPVLVTSFPRILNSGLDKTDMTAQMKRFPLLVIDDLGAERESDYSLEIVQQVVDERYKSCLPLIVTTNLTLQEMENPKGLRYARIYDRVLEMCIPMQFSGPSRRQGQRQEKMRLAREMLG